MIEWFPYERAPLGRTRLRYVDLDAVLTDGKVDRASKAPGFVLLFYGEEMDIVFVDGGDPVTAVRLHERQRSVVPLTAVKRRACAEREWGDVGYYQAPEPQLRAMFATASRPANLAAAELDVQQPGRIFSLARERAYDGVVEFAEKTRRVHYIVFHEGLPVHGFFADQRRSSDVRANESLSSRLERLFQPGRREGMRAAGYPHVDRLPVQAPPALTALYVDLLAAAVDVSAEATSTGQAVGCFGASLDALRDSMPALAGCRMTEAGRLEGDSTAPADQLTQAVAALLREALGCMERQGAPGAAEVIERITAPNRLQLEAHGFFERFAGPPTS